MTVWAADGGKGEELKAALVISDKIRPYLAALEGAVERLEQEEGLETEVFFLSEMTEITRPALLEGLSAEHFNFIIAIGPEAARYLNDSPEGAGLPAVFHTMMLNPESILGRETCGVFLNIPVSLQVEQISTYLPYVKRIGILHDPLLNREYVEAAEDYASVRGIRIVPLAVSSKRGIQAVLNRSWNSVDAVWLIPDRTVISESIIKYIIKDAFFHAIPVIGYNLFFSRSGALLSFVFDYRELGRQTAKLALDARQDGTCREQIPRFDVLVNDRVAGKLEVQVSEPQPDGGNGQ